MVDEHVKSERPDSPSSAMSVTPTHSSLPSVVQDLDALLTQRAKFPTIYADPPWPYSNTAARGAAENHYRTLPLDAIRSEPVRQLAAEKAHLHLWTTNAFLREAFDVIRAWGFEYKSCLVWIKPQLGMGNYWRVSHEFLLLGVRGGLPFRDRTCRSWLSAPRTGHSRKPFAFRALIERVSPGPYLELYGREHHPNTGWTVYGNQVERWLF
jgi:N6-adenosine-specific RNA methylase IME4